MTSAISAKPAMTAGALFSDQSFSFETLRALGYAAYGGADIGEVTSTASRIPDGDETAWYTQWRALAERIHADADASADAGHRVSARESYLRASNYYRLCEFYLRVDAMDDPLVREVGQLSVDMFACAAQLMSPAPERPPPQKSRRRTRVLGPLGTGIALLVSLARTVASKSWKKGSRRSPRQRDRSMA